MNSYELLPHEHDYAFFLSCVYDLWPYDPMILHMVSERYPRDEDSYASVEDSAADSNSAIAENEDLSHDDDMAISTPEVRSLSLCNHIIFGNFGNSDFATIQSPSITPIKPTIDGFTIKIGDITCILADSRCNCIEESVFEESEFPASEEHVKSKNLGFAFVVSEATKELNDHESEFGISLEFKQSENLVEGRILLPSVYGVAAIRSLASWYYVGKQKQHISHIVINNNVWPFELHDECIVDFDPDGITLVIYSSAIMLSFLSKLISLYLTIHVFIFDPGGNHHDFCSPLFLLCGGILDRVDTIFLLVELFHGKISILVNGIKVQLRSREYGKKMTENCSIQNPDSVLYFVPTFCGEVNFFYSFDKIGKVVVLVIAAMAIPFQLRVAYEDH